MILRSSPHLRKALPLNQLMLQVILASIPGIMAMVAFFGWGVLIHICIASVGALATEAAILHLRKKPIKQTLADNTALVTAVLYALCLPHLLPWWANLIGIVFAIAVAKQLYGGVGFNPFNPAMAGYVVIIISFPVQITLNWHNPAGLEWTTLSFSETLSVIFFEEFSDGLTIEQLKNTVDSVTHATPLDQIKTDLSQSLMASEITDAPLFGQFGGYGWEWINFAFFLGGLYLVIRKIADWRIPFAMIVSLWVCAMFMNAVDPDRYVSPLFHIVTGGTMLGAFFIATDPVSAATSPLGRLIYGGLIGFLVYLIRTFGNYPDGVAFAVLIMNMAVPTIDHYTQPRTYGHRWHEHDHDHHHP